MFATIASLRELRAREGRVLGGGAVVRRAMLREVAGGCVGAFGVGDGGWADIVISGAFVVVSIDESRSDSFVSYRWSRGLFCLS